jgi:DNA-binding transcriptional MerR regulator
MPHPLTIGQLAEAAGVPARTIRYYEQVGVMPSARRTASGYRQYPEPAVERLRFIRRARSLGLSLPRVRALVAAVDDGLGARARVRQLVRAELVAVGQRIAELQALQGELEGVLRRMSRPSRPRPGACRCLDGDGSAR